MSPLAFLSTAVRPLLRRPVRTLLLLQGTVWGVAVAVFPSAVVAGTRAAVVGEGRDFGADRVSITADPTAVDARPLVESDVQRVEAALSAKGIVADALGGAKVIRILPDGGALVAGDPGAPAARGLALAAGRWLRKGDPPDAAVVEARAAVGPRGRRLVPGDRLALDDGSGGTEDVAIVGITKPAPPALRRTNDLGFDVTHPLYEKVGRTLLLALGIPRIDDAWKRSDACVWVPLRRPAIDWLFLRVPPSDVKEASKAASAALVQDGAAPVSLHPLVLPILLGAQVERFDAVRTALFLACLAMGAVVMANLGLLAVLTRGREIAIRRVEGATRRTIALHFLLEGLVLAAIGSVLGCLLGMALAALRVAIEPVTGFAWTFPWHDGAVAVAVALLIGALAALVPAIRASRQEPVAGLAEE